MNLIVIYYMDSTDQPRAGRVFNFSYIFLCFFSGEKITAKCMEKDGVKNRDEV